MSESCAFCGKSVNPYDISTYKQVIGWVKGKKADSMTLREDTNKYAHAACINKAKAGQAVDQPDLLAEPSKPKMAAEAPPPDDIPAEVVEKLFEESRPSISELIEKSSLGTPAAKALIARVSDEDAAKVIERARQLEQEDGF